jgi:hypothetical protein
MKRLVYGGMRTSRSRSLSRGRYAFAAENAVLVIRPKNCASSDRKEAELRQAGIPFASLNPVDDLQQVARVLEHLARVGVRSGPTPLIIVNGTALCTNELRELRAFLRYAN